MNDNIFIISNKSVEHLETSNRSCIIVYLYYLDVKQYCEYLLKVPNEISLYVISSRQEVLDRCKAYLFNKVKIEFILKPNRGRDISALLIAARDIVKKYDYFAFLHDKTANRAYLEQDVKVWRKQLWDNTVYNSNYIYEVLNIFEENTKMGLLVPPEPYGEYNSHWYSDTWYDNYELTCLLAKKLKLTCDIKYDVPVNTLSTVFWARTVALKKLFEVDWKYEDFSEEPLQIDGTISHAIERIFGYVVEDYGYKTGTVMTAEYASELLIRAQSDMRIMFDQIKKREQILNLHQIKNLDEREKMILHIYDKYKKIYIFGAGAYGKNMSTYLVSHGLDFSGYIVSNGKKNEEFISDKPVYELGEIDSVDNIAIIIAVSYEYREEIENLLQENGMTNYIYGY